MKNYKDQNNQIHVLDSSEFESLLPAGCVEITQAEADAISNPPLTLAQAQAAQIALIEASYKVVIQADIDYLGTTFNADNSTQLLIVKVLSAGQVPDGFFWQDITNTQILMTYEQVQGFSAAILVRGQLAFVKLQELKTAIRAAFDVASVALIAW